MKIGIKSEIHSCTISFMKNYLNKYFTNKDIELITKSMEARIDVQYYTNRNISNEFYIQIIKNAPLFFVKCKQVLNQINDKSIKTIRENINKMK